MLGDNIFRANDNSNNSSSNSGSNNSRPRGKRKTQEPCLGCYLHKERCICTLIPKLSVQTKLTLIIHVREMKRTSNTGILAIKALSNSNMFVRGRPGELIDIPSILDSNYTPLILYPGSDSKDLNNELVTQFKKPIQLIVPDGNWRQASKIPNRYPELRTIPRVMIRTPNTEIYRMRSESTLEGRATLQAIAQALGVLEGEFIQKQLLDLYQLKLIQTMLGRGIDIRERL